MDKSPKKIEPQLIVIIQKFLADSGAERASRAVTIDASLEHDLGIGSLEKAELFHRIEKAFGIHLPDALMVEGRQVRDIVAAVVAAKPSSVTMPHEMVSGLSAKRTDPSSAKTLVEVLQLYAENEPDRPHIYLQDEKGEEHILPYGHLYAEARKTAQGLVRRGIKPGDTVAIMVPTSTDFFYAFFGTLLAGGIPVPIYPPFRADQIEEYAKREALILRNASVRILITFHQAKSLSKLLQVFIPSLLAVTTIKALSAEEPVALEFSGDSTEAALIQYTSGSTGNPKGVLLTHANLLANIRVYGEAIKIQPNDVAVSWLPLYHDMGLIGAWLGSLYYGIPLVLMSPLAFLARPERWLWAIHYHRGTLSAGPNFAYELCVKKIEDHDIQGLDLSSWRLALNGAEMIYPKTLEKFGQRFASYGFRQEIFFPVYGLAESSLALTFPTLGQPARVDRIQRQPFETENRAVPIKAEEKNYKEVIACGRPIAHHEIRIVNDDMQPVAERVVGNIQFRGPSSMQGYYRNPEATQAVYHEGWWDSGDLGYFAEGDLFITGRKKDLIIKAGRNYYPAEIEEVVSQVTGVRKGCVAAFGVEDATLATEKLVVVAETQLVDEKKLDQIRKEIIDKVIAQIAIPPDEVILVPPQTIPKTSSGKLRRSSCKASYLAGKLGKSGSKQMQLLRLFLQSWWKKLVAGLSRGVKFLFNLYVLLMVIITFVPSGLLILIFPRRQAAKIFRFWCRLIFLLSFSPIRVKDAAYLQTAQPMIFMANHSSYMDILIMSAVVPADSCFVAKKELLKMPVVNIFFKKLRHLTVDRLDFSKSETDAQRIKQVLLEGRSIIIFPEGTFSYATGIRLFKVGAFKIAMETKKPLCPMAIQGARTLLRANTYLLRPSIIHVTVGKPIYPQGDDWNEIVRLREVARAWIAKHSGEQTIDLTTVGIPPA